MRMLIADDHALFRDSLKSLLEARGHTVVAEARDLPVHLKAIGTVTPVNTVTVKPRVGGQLLRVAFEEGQRVEAG